MACCSGVGVEVWVVQFNFAKAGQIRSPLTLINGTNDIDTGRALL